MADKTVTQLIMEYFYAHPNEDLEHGPVVDWVSAQWLKSIADLPSTEIIETHQQVNNVEILPITMTNCNYSGQGPFYIGNGVARHGSNEEMLCCKDFLESVFRRSLTPALR